MLYVYKILTIYKLLDYFLRIRWPAISTFYIVLYGLLFINYIIFFSALFSLIIVFKWLMSNKLICIVIDRIQHQHFLVFFFVTEKNTLCHRSWYLSVHLSVCPSVRRWGNNFGQRLLYIYQSDSFQIWLKYRGLGNAFLKGAIFRNWNCKLQIYAIQFIFCVHGFWQTYFPDLAGIWHACTLCDNACLKRSIFKIYYW